MTFTSDVIRHILPNGLTLLVQREASAPAVAVVTHVKAGYFDEPDHWVGIAHVLEHMFFKGTARRGPGDIARETQILGGYLNAGTIYDKTSYYTVLPSAGGGLAHAVDIQADALMNAALDPGELARELEVIIQEVKRKLDNPGAVAGETLYELLFSVHRMRRWRIGTEGGLRRLTAADLRSYYTTRYTPSRTIVGLVGDLDPEAALRHAESIYGAWSREPVTIEASPTEPPGVRPQSRVLHGDVEKPIGTVGWRTAHALHDDTPALDVAASVLGAGRGSWLARDVRLPGLASGIHCSHYTPTEVGVFEVAMSSDDAKVDAAVDRSLACAADLAGHGPDDVDLLRVRALTATGWARRLESVDGRATALCEFEALADYRLADEMFDRTMAVTEEDIRRVASAYLDPAAACVVLYLPDGVRTASGDGERTHRPTGGQKTGDRRTSGQAVAPVAAASRPSRSSGRPSAIGPATHVALPGVDLLLQPKPGAGLLALGLYVPALRELETAETAGLSWLLARTALRGAAGMDAEALAIAAESLGGPIESHVRLDGVGWEMTVRPDAARAAADLLRRLASEPALDAGAFGVERGLQADDAARVHDDMYRYPIQRVLGECFAGDAYGLPVLGEPDSIRATGVESVRRWAEDLRSRRAIVVGVGDLSSNEMIDQLAPALEPWPGRTAPARTAAAPRWTPGRADEQRGKAQTALAMAFPAPAYGAAERVPLRVTSALLSGLAGRLFDALRERRSLAYTVVALPWLARRGGAMLGYIATSPGSEGEAREGMLAELVRVGAEPAGEEELERARNYAAGMLELHRQSARTVAADVLEAWVHGTLESLVDEPARLRAVRAEDVQRVAAAAFRADARAEYVVRGTGSSR